jgi:pyruvate formate lyase activating enzyme
MAREAMYWQPEGERVRCRLCPHQCLIADGKRGLCTVRENQGGRLAPLTYGLVTSVRMDPIEKKPLFHFHPGSQILSLGTWGCNLSCDFCQNWQISKEEAPTQPMAPNDAVALALTEQKRSRNIGIAFTYNEPLMWYEYLLDTSRPAHDAGLKNVLVTNGEIEEEPLRELLPTIDAMNVDVKSMSRDFYRRLCSGPEGPPRRTVEMAFGKCHVEVTNLLIPGENDASEQIRELVDWLAGVSDRIPLHFSRYHPAYRMAKPPTPLASLERAWRIAKEKLKYVYVGNAAIPGTEDTHCPRCGGVVVERAGFSGAELKLKAGKCGACGSEVDLVT